MKHNFLLLVLAAIALLFSGCIGNDYVFGKHVRGVGGTRTETRQVSKFDEIEIANNSDVEIYKGNELSVEVSDYNNIVQYTQVVVEGHRLIVKSEPDNINLSNSKSLVIIHMPEPLHIMHISGSGNMILKDGFNDITKLSISGSGNIEAEKPCMMNKVSASVSGSGDISFKGSASDAELHVSGSGEINFSEVKSQNVNAHISGSGNISSYVIGTLDAHISGSGDVEYYGHPSSVNSSVSGSGNVTHQE